MSQFCYFASNYILHTGYVSQNDQFAQTFGHAFGHFKIFCLILDHRPLFLTLRSYAFVVVSGFCHLLWLVFQTFGLFGNLIKGQNFACYLSGQLYSALGIILIYQDLLTRIKISSLYSGWLIGDHINWCVCVCLWGDKLADERLKSKFLFTFFKE